MSKTPITEESLKAMGFQRVQIQPHFYRWELPAGDGVFVCEKMPHNTWLCWYQVGTKRKSGGLNHDEEIKAKYKEVTGKELK